MRVRSNAELLEKYQRLLAKDPSYDAEKVKVSFFGRGKRKRSRGFCLLSKDGTGKLLVNNREFIEYFNVECTRFTAIKAIVALGLCDKVDVKFYVFGGGYMSQAEACMVAAAKALVLAFPEHERFLSERNFLWTDSRIVEPKKTGLYKARKKYQYVRR